VVVAEFESAPRLLAAVAHAREGGHEVLDVRTPFPVHGLDDAMGLRPSRLPWICFAAGMAGLLGGVALQVWTSAFDWPLNVGGKPFASLPAFVPVAFELVILFAGLATFFALVVLLRRRRPPGATIDVPRATDDRFALLVAGRDARFDARGLAEELVARGAVATQERFVDDPEDAEAEERR
jgi:hypothetical protein